MSPKNIPQMKFDSPVFGFTPVSEVKTKVRFKHLSFYPELDRIVGMIKKNKSAPFDDALTIDLGRAPSADKPYLSQKDPSLSFYMHVRDVIKKEGIGDLVEVRRVGDRIHIVVK